MTDEYGTEQIYLVKPTRINYSIYNDDPIKGINEYTFRTYRTCSASGVEGCSRMILNLTRAKQFAKSNGLILITDYEQDELLER